MHIPHPFSDLRDILQRAQDQGCLTFSPETAQTRFVALTELDMAPLVRHLAHRLLAEAVPAAAVVALDAAEPWLGLFFDQGWSRGLYVQPYDLEQMQLTLRFASEPAVEAHHRLRYRQFTAARFAYALERSVESLLLPAKPPL